MINHYKKSGTAALLYLGKQLSEHAYRQIWQPEAHTSHDKALTDIRTLEDDLLRAISATQSLRLRRTFQFRQPPTVADRLKLRIISYVAHSNLVAPCNTASIAEILRASSLENRMEEALEARRLAFRLCVQKILVCHFWGNYGGGLELGPELLDYVTGGNPLDSLVLTEAALNRVWAQPRAILSDSEHAESTRLPGLTLHEWKHSLELFRGLQRKADEIVATDKLGEITEVISEIETKPKWPAVGTFLVRLMQKCTASQTYRISAIADEFLPGDTPGSCLQHLLAHERCMFERHQQFEGLERNRRKFELAAQRGCISGEDQANATE